MKNVVTWIFAAAVIAGTLYVYKQYKDIDAGSAATPKAAPSKPAPPSPAKSAAATTAAPGAAQGFEGLPFGADEAAVLAKFGAQVQKVPSRQEFLRWYVDYVIPEYKMAGVPFEVLFQMDNITKRLDQVLLRKESDNLPLGSYNAEFKAVLDVLTEKHGKPAGTLQGARDATFREAHEWASGPVTINLSHDQTVWGSGHHREMLTVRYFPSNR